MSDRTTNKSTNGAKNAAAKRGTAKAADPRKTAPPSRSKWPSRKATTPALKPKPLSGGNHPMETIARSLTDKNQLLLFYGSVKRDPAIAAWMKEHGGELGAIARYWFEVIRDCGNDVQELLHDGHPTACVDDAAFAYVNAFKAHVNVGFFRGAELSDPNGLLEGSGKFMRHVKLRPDSKVDTTALTTLVRAAYTDMKRRLKPKSLTKAPPPAAKPKLLSGGNPQITKGDGDEPVQAYIAAMPGWKREVGHRLDALIARTVPGVRKAVKWNSPFYGVEGQGWFLSFHCFTKYVKVTFFRGTSLRPVPPGASKHKDVRYLDIHEDDRLDEAQLTTWVKQASQLPGERL